VLNSRKYFHYLIDRAQQQFPGKSPDTKVKAVNYLLPHIHRVPSRIVRDELAAEVSQRLQIDSAVLRQELRSAASTRSQKLDATAIKEQPVSPAEKLLVRALLAPELRGEVIQMLASEPLHEGWPSESLITALLSTGDHVLADPMSLDLNDASRALLATILMAEDTELSPDHVRVAVAALRRPHIERRLQQVQHQIDDAGRKNDAMRVAQLSAEKVSLKRALDESMRANTAR
jgi:DNA primase